MVNEFRKDIASGEWVLISSMRARRPHDAHRERLVQSVQECVFEPDRLSEQSAPLLAYTHGVQDSDSPDWTTIVIKNKYPALQEGTCGEAQQHGPHMVHAAYGFHEIVITRDHDRHFAHFSTEETLEVLQCYRDRYQAIAQDDCGDYISIFHNHGRAAGASVYHNHSQIISTPVVPPEVARSVRNAGEYFRREGRGVHEVMIEWEKKEGKRIVYENELFIAFCPFVSKAGYEVRIFPKLRQPKFEAATDADLRGCAEALNTVLRKLHAALDDVDYNFYIHTAPVAKASQDDAEAYHWHLDVVPRIPVAAGFELSTAININSFDPDDCAEHLRNTSHE
jgi:UDPglucose--hexose-1-phosphate uridylyltransferase